MPFDLPPGCRFYPSDQQLLCYYLTNKNHGDGDGCNQHEDTNGYDLIKELDLYDHEPFDLPQHSCYSYGPKGRKKHWFCYAKIRVSKEENRGNRRRAKGGYWRRLGKVRDVMESGWNSAIVGTRTRVFVKSRIGNSVSENILSCCAEESVSALRHIGVQCDGISDHVQHETSSGDKNEVPEHLLMQNNTPAGDTSGTNGFASVSGYQYLLPANAPPDQNHEHVERKWFTDADPSELLQIIMEEDYLEMDDLK